MELDQPLEQTPEQQADAMAGSGLRTVMKRALPASAKGPLDEKIAPPIKITDEEGYNALNPGMRFIDPEGNTRTKAWTVANEEDYDLVPEGKEYLDPEGNTRTKPAYEDVDLTASTLYHMAVNDTERRKALERSYPGKVQQDTQGKFYVDEDGKRRRPKNMLESPTGAMSTVAGAAAPMIGSAVGEGVGAGAGATFGAGVGALPGGIAGAGAGGALGQGFNDIILQLAGIYDRSGGEEAANLAMAGGSAALGSGVGRGIGGVVGGAGGVKGALQGGAGSGVAAKFLGADPEGLESAIGLREKGVLVPPSMWAKGAPHVQNMAEVFHPAFDTSKPLLKSATEHYEKTGASVLDQIGIKDAGSLSKPTAAASSREAGEALQAKVLQESQAADAELRRVLDERRAGLQAGLPAAQERQAALNRAADNSRREAERLLNQGYEAINRDMNEAVRVSGSGHNGGELWERIGAQFQAVKRGLQERATTMYNQADELAGGHLPNVQNLPELAAQFAEQLPEEFQRNQPAVVRQLRAMAGERNPETGEMIREPTQPTFGQLHNLRSQIRSNADFYRLNSDLKNGAYKFFARRVDEALHDPHAVPELQAAARQLDRADAFYRENMPIFEANQIKSVMRGLESGEPADPQKLFDAVVKEGHTDLTNRIREMVGPNLWAGVQAADLRQILNSSRGLIEGEIDGSAFTRQVLDRHRSGILDAVHGRDVSQRLLRQAQDVAALDGRIPLQLRPGDRMADAIAQAHATAEAARVAAKTDPLRTLNAEMKRIEREHAQAASKARSERKNDPLSFLYDPTYGATKAADNILKNEDLLIAAAARFDPKSPEFNMLRQVWTQRFLRDTLKPSERLKTVSPEVQNIMFPGVTLKDMQTLAKEMDFLMSSKGADAGAGLSMSATSKVEHPWGSIAGGGGVAKALTAPLRIFPGDMAGRTLLEKYYGMVTKLSNNIAFMKWVQRGLNGDSTAREVVKEAVQRAMKVGGAGGAAIGESQYQAGSEGLPPQGPPPAPQQNQTGGNQILGRQSSLPQGGMMSDASPDPVQPGAQYAMNEPQQAKPSASSGRENLVAADREMHLTPQEKALYEMHLKNLNGPGGVDNPNGSRSSLLQATVETDGKAYSIPTVWDGKIHTADEAWEHWKGQIDKFPSYASEDEAEARYQKMHEYMDRDTEAYQRGESKNESVLPREEFNFLSDAEQAAEARGAAASRQREAVKPAGGRQESEATESMLDLVPGRGAVRSLAQGEYGEATLQAGMSALPYGGKALGAAARAFPAVTKAVGAATAALTGLLTGSEAGKIPLSPEQRQRLQMEQQLLKQKQDAAIADAKLRTQEAEDKAKRDAEAAQQSAKTQADLQERLARIEAEKEQKKAEIEAQRHKEDEEAAQRSLDAAKAEAKRMAERPFREKYPSAALGLTMGGMAVAAMLPVLSNQQKASAINKYIREWEKLDKAAADALKSGTTEEKHIAVQRLSDASNKWVETKDRLSKPDPVSKKLAVGLAGAEGAALPAEIDFGLQPKDSEAHKSAEEFFTNPMEMARVVATYLGGTMAGMTASKYPFKTAEPPVGSGGLLKAYEQQQANEKKLAAAAKRAKTLAAKKTEKPPERLSKGEEKETRKARVPKALLEVERRLREQQ